ncbi:hypothetical protein BH24CHL9_BH24CHL9_09520 [soil metagenome]
MDLVEDSRGRPMALFTSPTILSRIVKESPPGTFAPVGIEARDPLAGLAA